MGRTKELYMEMLETESDRQLAKLLGISYEDFSQLEYEIETDSSRDGMIYNYRIVFSDTSPKKLLKKIKRLDSDNTVYLEPWELGERYDYDEQFEAITSNKDTRKNFITELSNLEKLSKLKIEDPDLEIILKRQIFIGVIATLETFLSDAFINLVNDNENYFRKFIETHPEFKQRKFELREIFTENEKLKETAKKVMLDTIYHNLPSVSQMFADTFEIKFPEIKKIYELILKRHDLVHRNGKTKDQTVVTTDSKSIKELIRDVSEFGLQIADALRLR